MTSPLAATAGPGLVQDVYETVAGIRDSSWVDASLGSVGVGVSLEAFSLVLADGFDVEIHLM
ncbi:hypothetical protein ACQP2E_10485 [Actinoplanes sp. CA-015351]|uniref:hypothetical protein n=1 Tax=Actinoplanes sp. CA-015351 TaxID=3239897 RepID=UPI003D976DAF